MQANMFNLFVFFKTESYFPNLRAAVGFPKMLAGLFSLFYRRICPSENKRD